MLSNAEFRCYTIVGAKIKDHETYTLAQVTIASCVHYQSELQNKSKTGNLTNPLPTSERVGSKLVGGTKTLSSPVRAILDRRSVKSVVGIQPVSNNCLDFCPTCGVKRLLSPKFERIFKHESFDRCTSGWTDGSDRIFINRFRLFRQSLDPKTTNDEVDEFYVCIYFGEKLVSADYSVHADTRLSTNCQCLSSFEELTKQREDLRHVLRQTGIWADSDFNATFDSRFGIYTLASVHRPVNHMFAQTPLSTSGSTVTDFTVKI